GVAAAVEDLAGEDGVDGRHGVLLGRRRSSPQSGDGTKQTGSTDSPQRTQRVAEDAEERSFEESPFDSAHPYDANASVERSDSSLRSRRSFAFSAVKGPPQPRPSGTPRRA